MNWLRKLPRQACARWRETLALGAMAAACAGCSTAHNNDRIMLPEGMINGHPVHFALDTGSALPLVTGDEAGAASMHKAYSIPHGPGTSNRMSLAVSSPAQFNLGSNNLTAPFVIADAPDIVELHNDSGKRLTGIIGWPEVWNNILVFDGPHRKVTVADKVPPEAAHWLKLRILPNRQLTLETPEPNGPPGVLLVDTGSYIGVGLPPAQWKRWHAAHPDAPTAALAYYTPGIGMVVNTEAWADSIELGSFALTDLPVHEANAAEMTVDPTRYAGTLGLYALARMNLVLDGAHGIAYLKPLPPPGPYFSAFNRAGIVDDTKDSPTGGDWTLVGDIKLDGSNLAQDSSDLIVDAATDKIHQGDFDGGYTLYAKALEAYPASVHALMRRGQAHELENNFEAAIADYHQVMNLLKTDLDAYERELVLGRIEDLRNNPAGAVEHFTKAIHLQPQLADGYELRGVDRQIMGGLADALSDFNHVVELQPGGFTMAEFYGEVVGRWLGSPHGNLSAASGDEWAKSTAGYLDGKVSEPAYLAVGNQGKMARMVQCQTYYFIGMSHFLKGDLQGARVNLQNCISTNAQSLPEYRLANATLAQLAALGVK